MAKYSGLALVNFAKGVKNNGGKYLYGANTEILTLERLNQLRANFPSQITENRYNTAKNNYIGKIVADCSGLIYGYTKDGTRRTSLQLWNKASKRFTLNKSNISNIPIGAILYQSGHVGIYQGNGKTIEALGFDYGIVERNLNDTAFTHYLLFDDFDYKTKNNFPWWLVISGITIILLTKKRKK